MAAKLFRTKVNPEGKGRKAKKVVKLTVEARCLVLDVLVDTWNTLPEHTEDAKGFHQKVQIHERKM